MISFNSTHVVGGRVKLCLNHPKPGGIIVWGMWAIFWCNINTLFFCSQHTGTLGYMGIPGLSTMFLGISAVGVIPSGCASRSGSRCRGGFNLSIGKCLIFRWFKFTLKPPYSGVSERSLSAIWDTSHWNFFVKFGLRTA